MHKWLLTLLNIHHSRRSLNSLSLLNSDFLCIKYHKLNKSFDHNHTVVGFSSNRIVNQRQIEQLRKLGQLFNFEELLDSVVGDVKSLQLLKFFYVGQGSETVFVELQDHDLVVGME